MKKKNIKSFLKTLINFVIFAVVNVIYIVFKPVKRYADLFCILIRHSIWKVKLASLGKNTIIRPCVTIHTPENVKIGQNVSIVEFVHIWGGGIEIGDDTMIAAHSIITSLTHDITNPLYRKTLVKRPVIIGKGVWVGSGVIILPGIKVGDGAVIGAGSIVTKDVAPNSLVLGNPARIHRYIDNS